MPKRIDLAVQRRLIADAAIAVIDGHGLEGARLRDVARAADVTTGAITHYFEDKDAVLEAALEEIVRRTLERIEAGGRATVAQDITAFVERVHKYLPIDAQARGEWRVWLAFWARAIADDRLQAVHRRYYAAIVEHTVGSLQHLRQARTGRPPEELRRLADAVIAAVDGVGTRATLEPGLWPAKRQRETIDQLVTPMLSLVFDDRDHQIKNRESS